MTRPLLLSAALTAEAVSAPSDRDCCVYAHQTLRHYYSAPLDMDVDLWRIFAEADGSVPPTRWWGPVEAARRAGLAEIATQPPTSIITRAGRWHLCQGWRGVPGSGASGHTWLYRALDVRHGLVVDSTPTGGPATALVRWADLTAPYRHGVAVAVLRRAG